MASDREDRWDGDEGRDRWDDDRTRRPGGDPVVGRGKVKLPGVLMIVAAVIGLLNAVYGLIAVDQNIEQIDQLMQQFMKAPPMTPEQKASQKTQTQITSVIGLVGSLVAIVGGIAMVRLGNRGLAMTGSVVSMIPIVHGCCCLGIPIGLWAMIVLNSADVKAAFAASAAGGPGRDRDDDERDRGYEQ